MNYQARFAAHDAQEARAEAPVPLLIGLTGPSGSGKTYSALRIATGIQLVVGGKIFVVDTESRRSLHYSDTFKFDFVEFKPPFGSLDYLEALRFCKTQGAGVVVIDSCSHEHDGPGGMLEQHEAFLDKMDPSGNDFKKREKMAMVGWAKVKPARRKLISAITTELNMPVIFCFRAKKTTKPQPGQQPVDMGFTIIGADEWQFEMALNALLLPGSQGRPTWNSDLPGERMTIKLPAQFRNIVGDHTLDENMGVELARWAAASPAPTSEQPKPDRATAAVTALIARLEAADDTAAILAEETTVTQRAWLKDKRPELSERLEQFIALIGADPATGEIAEVGE